MDKLNRPWLYAVLITAILVLTQAVFLLLPTLEANAANLLTINFSQPVTNGSTISGTIPITYSVCGTSVSFSQIRSEVGIMNSAGLYVDGLSNLSKTSNDSTNCRVFTVDPIYNTSTLTAGNYYRIVVKSFVENADDAVAERNFYVNTAGTITNLSAVITQPSTDGQSLSGFMNITAMVSDPSGQFNGVSAEINILNSAQQPIDSNISKTSSDVGSYYRNYSATYNTNTSLCGGNQYYIQVKVFRNSVLEATALRSFTVSHICATNVLSLNIPSPAENSTISSSTPVYVSISQSSGFTSPIFTNLRIYDQYTGSYLPGYFIKGLNPQSNNSYTINFTLKEMSAVLTSLANLVHNRNYRLDVFSAFGTTAPSTPTISRNFVYHNPTEIITVPALSVSFYNKPTAAPTITANSYTVQANTNANAYIKISLYQVSGTTNLLGDSYGTTLSMSKSLTIDTTALANNTSYRLVASAKNSAYTTPVEDSYYFLLNRPATTPTPTTYSLNFYNMGSGVISVKDSSPSVTFKAQATNISPNEIFFNISGTSYSNKLTGTNSSGIYTAVWNLSGLPFGTYTVSLSANTTVQYTSDSMQINYLQDYVEPTPTPAPIQTTPFEIHFDQTLRTPVTGEIPLSITLNKPAASAEIEITSKTGGSINKIALDPTNGYENTKFACSWFTNKFGNGVYRVKAAAYDNIGVLMGTVLYGDVEVKNTATVPVAENTATKISETTAQPVQPAETLKIVAPVKTLVPVTKESIASEPVYTTPVQKSEPTVTDLCRQHGIENYFTCSIFLSLDKACQAENITNNFECDDYLKTLKLCAGQNIPADKCRTALKLPSECRLAKIFSAEECKTYLFRSALPEVCVKAGVSTQAECQQIVLQSSLPQECVEAGFKSIEDCRAYLAKKQTQQECIEANIYTAESCKIYMFKKYGLEQNLGSDKIPLVCTQANVQSAAECDKLLTASYLPADCQSAGLTNAADCQYLIDRISLPVECSSADIKTKDECNSYMLDKFGPELCSQAGVNEKNECKNYLFNKFSNEFNCTGQDKLICQYALKNQYLGYIVAKQLQFRALKEYAQKNRGLSVSASDLLGSEITENITPVKDKKTILKIVATDQKLVLDNTDNLVQTSPVALMIDSDGDGLPDDIEKTIGTDPGNQDSDGDGYFDGDEVRGGYDPLGSGKKKLTLSPIEEALVGEMTIGHPKSDGTVSDKYLIKEIRTESIGSSTDQKTIISGQAEPNSTITLYLYSDLPLVAVVKTDAFGNWQYQIDRPLQDGGHEVYATLNDNTGRVIEKSSPFQFFIKEAKALSPQDFVANDRGPSRAKSMLNIYLGISGLIILAGLLLFVGIYYFNRSKPIVKY